MDDVNEPASPSRGPAALKAFAHPLRMAIYDYLTAQGSATATQVGRHLGESSGQTSYHLRQLAKHGIIEDDPEHTGGRERWWRPVSVRFEAEDLFEGPEGTDTAVAVVQGLLADRARVLTAWSQNPGTDPAWRRASTIARGTEELTPDEARALVEALEALVHEHLGRAKERREAGDVAGRRTVRVYMDVLPIAGEVHASAPGDAGPAAR
jgi:DNA-binding transcriptional ArsR family regulator